MKYCVFVSACIIWLQRGKWDTQHLYLVHLVPDWSNLQHLDRSDIPGLVLFIKYLNQRKAQRLIPVVE